MAKIRAVVRWLVNWFEDGDLVPLLVIVSAAHYITILSLVDPWYVALPLGVLVDLGHYRAVNIAARYSGTKWYQYAIRWFVAAGLTIISGAYHWRYYGGDWALALPIPALIVALAYFRRMKQPIAAKSANAEHKENDAIAQSKTQSGRTQSGGNGHKPQAAWLPIAIELHAMHPEWNKKQLAQAVGVHPSTVGRALKQAQEETQS